MSNTSYNFKDNLTIDNNKYLKWLDVTGITRSNVIALDTANNVNLNSANGDVYINSNNGGSHSFINANNSRSVIVASNLGVGFQSTANVSATLTIAKNGFIGTNTMIGTSDGYLGIAGSHSMSSSSGSQVMLWGNNATTGFAGKVEVHAGNTSTGSINFYTGNDSLKQQILPSGTVMFSPDGATSRMVIEDNQSMFTNDVILASTTASTGASSGALVVNGGIGVLGNCFVDGTLSINSVTGNINFDSSQESSSYTTGAIYIFGGLGISNTNVASSVTAGGALSVAGGVAIGKNVFVGGDVVVLSSTPATSSQNASLVLYGGMGVNDAILIRSNNSSQVKLAPSSNGTETSIAFHASNNFSISSTGASSTWWVGQNVQGAVGSGNFGIYSFDTGPLFAASFNGNIGISRTSPSYKLDVNGTMRVSGSDIDFDQIYDTATMKIGGWKLWSNNTSGHSYLQSGNASRGSGSFSPIRITSYDTTVPIVEIFSTTPSHNATTGTLVVHNGGMSINHTSDASSVTSGGALTVRGGASIQKNVYIGGPVLKIPTGNTSTRPMPAETGYIRYNSETEQFEGFGAADTWGSLGGIIDVNQDTKILAEDGAGTNDDNLRFFTFGTERMRITKTGLVGIGTTAPVTTLHLDQSNSAALTFGDNSSTTSWYIHKDTNGLLGFYNGSWSTGTARLIMTTSGNVGIAQANPQYTLDVDGSTNISGNLYVTGEINGSGSSSSTFAYLTLTAVDDATDSNGALVSFGGITVQNTTDCVSLLSGGSLLTLGGASIGKNLLVGIGVSTGAVKASNATFGNILVSDTIFSATLITSSNLAVTNVTSTNIQNTNLSTGTILASTLISSSNLATSTFTATNSLSTNHTSTNIIVSNITTGTIRASTLVSSGNIAATNITTSNLLVSSTAESVGVGTGGSLTVLGGASFSKDVYVGGTITSSSDIRLKENIRPLKNSKTKMLDLVEDIRTARFTYKSDPRQRPHIGFLAQDFEQNFRELLRTPDASGYYTLDYPKITVLLLECIKELRQDLQQLHNRLKDAFSDC